jgi:ubiquinone/menaquinone biosynthesis C-methylase UbiE
MTNDFVHEPASTIDGIPCFLDHLPPDKYLDSEDLTIYRDRYEERLRGTQICQGLMLSHLPAGSRVLSVAEGTGEVVLSFAEKYPELRFYGFDLMPNRVRIAVRLARQLGVKNVTFYIGSAEFLPFPDQFFQGVIERGIFHTLPLDVKTANLAEIERTCRGPVVMNWMVRNSTIYIVRQWCRSLILRDPKTWQDAYATYRNIDKRYNTLKKLARLIETETGHSVRILRSYAGDRELAEDRPSLFSCFEPHGGLAYATDD